MSDSIARTYHGFELRGGRPLPYGATLVPGGIMFSVNSNDAESCSLALFRIGEDDPFAVIPFFEEFRIGNVWSMIVMGIDPDEIEYGYILNGPYDPGSGLMFDKTKILIDPYARIVSGREIWCGKKRPLRSRVYADHFDWQGDRPLERDMRDLIIYEMHIRGFTKHRSSGVEHPGTYAGMIEKIPYLKDLGVNCVELMPVFEFDELENTIAGPGGKKLLNYWGYSSVSFFAPKAGYAASGERCGQAAELKTLIRTLHQNGIEVILDVVFNHTAEMGADGPYISFRGIDNRAYYMLSPNGEYLNFSGCGNTMNCNHPIVRSMILECLRYWTSEYHVDGFRFDLASILGRDRNGAPMSNPPLLEILAHDSVLGRTKLIAEAWDAGGVYQVGSFPSWGRWAEWNGKYRDDIRRFLKGDHGMAHLASEYVKGSPHMYDPEHRGECASVNFITCHDGFTLRDLFTYGEKQNKPNGEDNRDGANDNNSWDCVLDGASPEETEALRRRMMKNAITFLLVSRGVPMLLAGDEFGNSQKGNNNAYCQDNEISWLNWRDMESCPDVFEHTKRMIALRHKCDCIKSPHMKSRGRAASRSAITLHGVEPNMPDLSPSSTILAVMFADAEHCVYAAFNMHWEPHEIELPAPPSGKEWRVYAHTYDAEEIGRAAIGKIKAPPRTSIVLEAVPIQ